MSKQSDIFCDYHYSVFQSCMKSRSTLESTTAITYAYNHGSTILPQSTKNLNARHVDDVDRKN